MLGAVPLNPLAKRMGECPLRRHASCGDVDVALGFSDAMPIDKCDQCWARGGPYTPEARAWREEYVQLVVSVVKKTGVHTYPPRVRAAILERHTEPDERPAINAAIIAHDALPRVEVKTTRWLGLTFEGIPYPKRPFIAAVVAWRSFVKTWKAMKQTGCGCIKSLKDLVR